ncbi:MAG: hypothetical protein ACXACX_06025 [Candidatus Hodarchaeales archaeon]|jgi:hypothetical protein
MNTGIIIIIPVYRTLELNNIPAREAIIDTVNNTGMISYNKLKMTGE